MNLKKIITTIAVGLCFATFAFAQEVEVVSPWNFSITTDFAYYPKSDYIAGNTHFAPLTGAYSGLEGRVTGSATYTIPTPLGEHWLLNSATLDLTGELEVSPVSIKPALEIKWTPLPFIVFSAGSSAGTGWNLAGLQGMAELAQDGKAYNDLKPFGTYFVKWFVQGTFQFDTGAVIAGDWTHFQIMYTYQVFNEMLTGIKNQDVWEWQCSGNKVNGLQNYQNLVLAYQMPLTLSRVGVLTEIESHYNKDAFSNPLYKSDFKRISISPLAQLTFDDHNVLSILAGFSSRRSFTTDHKDSIEETALTYSGYEWFFNRIALSWTYTF